MSSQINTLEVINLFSSAKIFIGSQFSYLTDHGINMHLICSPHEELDDFARDQKIKDYQAIQLNRQLTPFKDLLALYKICKFIKKNQINTIIGHQPKGTLLTVLAGKIMRVPNIILFAHGTFYETETGIKKVLFVNLDRFLSRFSNKIVCVSQFVVNIRKELKIDKPGKCVMLGSGTCGGIDTKLNFNPELIDFKESESLKLKLGLKPNDFVIGFVGRLVRDKGIVELIEAYKILKEKHKMRSFKLLLVGDFELRDSVPQQYIDFIRNEKDIILTGFVNSEIELYYSMMNTLILPSYRDGFGLSLIEASSMKVPVLASKITGCVNAVSEGVSGYFVDLSGAGIAEGIEKMFDPDLRFDLGSKGREWVSANFDHTVVWPHMLSLLQNRAV